MAQIVLIDGDAAARESVASLLRDAGHEVMPAESGRRGLHLLERRPHLVLLELALPDTSGVDVCRAIRSSPDSESLPLVFLSERSRDVDRVMGFELGADDFIAKPFNPRELVLRIGALLRRTGAPEGSRKLCVFGGLRIDREAHRVWVDGQRVALTAIEFRLLLTLYEQRERVQTRQELLDEVWGASARISVRTVDAHVKRLRERIGSARDYIETVRGVGYRFADAPSLTAAPPRSDAPSLTAAQGAS